MYEIIGIYKGQREVLDTADDKTERDYMLQEYSIAFGSDWTIYAIEKK